MNRLLFWASLAAILHIWRCTEYPFLIPQVKTITQWSEYFITKENSQYVLFIYYDSGQPDNPATQIM